MRAPIPGTISESEANIESSLALLESALQESIHRRSIPSVFPNQVASIRQRRLALLRLAEIRLILE